MTKELKIKAHFTIIDPVGYIEMISLLQNCSLVMTDSGGLQKEAYFSRKICITIREETEWKELVEAGVNFIAGTSCSKIIETFESACKARGNFDASYYGDGNAAKIITKTLLNYRDAMEGLAAI